MGMCCRQCDGLAAWEQMVNLFLAACLGPLRLSCSPCRPERLGKEPPHCLSGQQDHGY